MDRLVITKFSNEIACAIGFGYTRLTPSCRKFPVNEFNLHALKVFHLEQFAMYDTYIYLQFYANSSQKVDTELVVEDLAHVCMHLI